MTRQYETCEHRYDTKNPDAYCLTPCPICEADEKKQGGMGVPLFVIALAVAGILVWALS